MPKTYMIGNWKMNHGLTEINDFFEVLRSQNLADTNCWIAPQAIHVGKCLSLADGTTIKIGAQNCSNESFGAYTGEVSADSLKEIGAHFVLLGHSERRSYFQETNKLINLKIKKVLEKELVPVLCCGETLTERESNQTLDVVLGQLRECLNQVTLKDASQLLIAYEPVWAIGTGKTATPEQAEEVHAAIRTFLSQQFGKLGEEMSILYGGSVKPANVTELLAQPNINGGLVGGASLKADSFGALCNSTH